MKKTIVYDFTKGVTEKVALVPASIVKRMLFTFQQSLVATNADEIVRGHAEEIRNISYAFEPAKVMDAAIDASEKFIETNIFINKVIEDKEYDSSFTE